MSEGRWVTVGSYTHLLGNLDGNAVDYVKW